MTSEARNHTMTRKPERQFFSKRELADFLGLSIFTIDAWVSQRREIPFVKMGRRVMFAVDDVEAWIRQRKVMPRPD